MEILCLDFLNSEFRDFRGRWVQDRLYQPQWVEEFCMRWGFRIVGQADDSILSEFARTRSILRRMVEMIADGQQLSYQDVATLDSILTTAPVVRHLVRTGQQDQQYQLELLPLQKDWNWMMTEIVASFAELITYYDPRRLKVCANANCRAVFYDKSKNRTKSMCSEKCSNLLKLQRFRARHKDDGEGEHNR